MNPFFILCDRDGLSRKNSSWHLLPYEEASCIRTITFTNTYENGELVVETVNIHPQQLSQSSVPITKQGRITERFSRYSDDEIFYQFIVEDDNIYRQPWTAELSFYATDGQLYEYACHEGNYAMPGSLAGARRLEMDANQGQ